MAYQDILQLAETHDRQLGLTLHAGTIIRDREANHRIANHLAILASTVSIRATELRKRQRTMRSEDVALILGEMSAKISTIAWLHRFLSKEPAADCIDLNDHLYQLCETLLSALSDPARVRLVKAGIGLCTVATDAAVPLCLIVTEAVTNSLKYAHPANVNGIIAVGCREDTDGALIVEASDDGVGLPEGFDFLADGGTGARKIRALARQLGAQVSCESRPIGLLFSVRVPAGPNPHTA
jgi:two-component sensor histidine kinase